MPTFIKTGFWETLKTTAPKNWLNLTKLINDIVDSNYKPSILGSLKITDTPPTTQGLYILSEVGTYTNLGGINAPIDKLNFASFDGTTWSLISIAHLGSSEDLTVVSLEPPSGIPVDGQQWIQYEV